MILQALFLRPVRRRPARFLATILGVAAGVAAVVATLASSRAAVESLQSGVMELSGQAALEVTRPGGLDEEELSRLAPLATDAWIAPVVEILALCPALGDSVHVLGVDPLVDARVRDLGAPMRDRFSSPAGALAFIELLAGRGAFVPEPLARELGLTAGDALAVLAAGKPAELRVLAVVPVPEGTSAFDRLVVVDVALAERLAGTPGSIDRAELVPRAGVDVEDLRHRASQLVSPGVVVQRPRVRAIERAGLVRSLEFNLTALSGISVIVGAVLVATTLATSVVQRRRTIALLHSLGASRAQVVRAILIEALGLGLLGGAAGVGLGYAGARLLHGSMQATVSSIVTLSPTAIIRPSVDHVLAGLGLGLLAALVAAVLPVIEGARTPPIQALRGEAPAFLERRARRIAIGLSIGLLLLANELARLPAWRGLPVAALVAAFLILVASFAIFGPAIDAIGRAVSLRRVAPMTFRLACAGLSAGRRRAAWGACAVAVAVALSVAIAALVTSFRTSIDEWTAQSLRADLSIRPLSGSSGLPLGKLDPEILRIVRRALPEAGIDPYFAARATFAGQRMTIAGAALGVVADHSDLALIDGSDPRPALRRAQAEHAALVNEAGVQRFGWRVGDLLVLDVRGQRVERRVIGVYRDYSDSGGVVVVEEDEFRVWYPEEGPLTIGVHCASPADVPATRARILEALGSAYRVDVLENAAVRANVMAVFDRTFAITQALQGVSAIVAVIAVLSVLYALVSERRADLALLAAVGASARQLAGVVCLQAGLLGLVGAGGGILAGLLIGLVIVKVVNLQSFGWTLGFVQPWNAMASTTALVALACMVAGLLPARNAVSARPGAALREE